MESVPQPICESKKRREPLFENEPRKQKVTVYLSEPSSREGHISRTTLISTQQLRSEIDMEPNQPQQPSSDKEFMEIRQQLQERLVQFCAQDMQNTLHNSRGDPGNLLLDLRVKVEQLTIDVHALITALIALKVIDSRAFAVTAYRLMEDRVNQLREAQSKIVVVRGKPQ